MSDDTSENASGSRKNSDNNRIYLFQQNCSDKYIRHYEADGELRAERDSDQHIIVADGDDHDSQWKKRVPAQRTSITEGEKLWTIPDNWELQVKVSWNTLDKEGVYHIPETNVDVLVSMPTGRLNEAYYCVEKVGKTTVDFDDEFNLDALTSYLNRDSTIELISGDVFGVMIRIHQQWDRFTHRYEQEVDRYASEAFWSHIDEKRIESKSIKPWKTVFPVGHVLLDVVDADRSTIRRVGHRLRESGAIPEKPNVRITVKDDKRVQ